MADKKPKSGNILEHYVSLREVVGNTLCLTALDDPEERDFAAVLKVNSVNFSLKSEEEQEGIIESFRAFLNGITFPIQILVRVRPYELSPYLKRLASIARHNPERQYLASEHIQFIRSLAARRSLIDRDFYIIVPAHDGDEDRHSGRSRAEQLGHAQAQLDLRITEIMRQLGRVGLTAHRLKREDVVRLYHSSLTPDSARRHPIPDAAIAGAENPTTVISRGGSSALHASATLAPTGHEEHEAGKSTRRKHKEKVPSLNFASIAELVAPAAIELTRSHVRLDDEYARALTVVGYPRHVYPGWLDRLIQIEEPMVDFVMHIQPQDVNAMIRRLSRRLNEFQGSRIFEERQGKVYDPEREVAVQDVVVFRDQLARGDERVFGFSLYILVHATNRQGLKERTERVMTALDSLQLVARPATFEHDIAFLSCMPEGRNRLMRQRPLDTSSIATAFPFASSTLSMETGVLQGVMPNGSLVVIDPFSSELENANQVVFAKSGAGKSYACKVQMLRSLLNGVAVCIIDPENEYKRMCDEIGGQYIRLAPGSPHYLNPFDLMPPAQLTVQENSNEEDLLAEKFQALHTLFDLLLADRLPGQSGGTLSQREKGLLDRCLYEVYRRKGITADIRTHYNKPPLLRDIYDLLVSGACGSDTFGLADRLQRYVMGSLSQLFSHYTNVELENPFVVFNVRDLDSEMRPIGLTMITDFVWTRMRRERQNPRPRLLLIDEAWTLMQYAEGGRFLAGLARRARKYYLGLITITQDVEDFLSSEWGRTILNNASIKLLMKQDSSTIEPVTAAFHLSTGEKRFLLACNKGEGLYFARGSHVALHIETSTLEHKLATTDPRELAQEQAARKAVTPDNRPTTVLAVPSKHSTNGTGQGYRLDGYPRTASGQIQGDNGKK